MLKQYLTKVIAVATIAAGAVFITGCGAEETVQDDGKPDISEDGKENDDNPQGDPEAGGGGGEEGGGEEGN